MNNALRSHFTLLKPSKSLDRRINAARGDLADVALAGKIFVPHYAEPLSKSVICERAGVYHKPSIDATMDTELLAGEQFAVLDVSGGWAWGYCHHDHYVGYIESHHLGDVKSLISSAVVLDWVQYALSYLDTSYVWGGRSRAGIDCSGLVQVALAAGGISAPRDTDMQMAALGTVVEAGTVLQRGDLIFFPGHVGIMVNGEHLLHATGFHKKTIIEPLADVVARIGTKHSHPIVAQKRLK